MILTLCSGQNDGMFLVIDHPKAVFPGLIGIQPGKETIIPQYQCVCPVICKAITDITGRNLGNPEYLPGRLDLLRRSIIPIKIKEPGNDLENNKIYESHSHIKIQILSDSQRPG